MDKDRVAGSAKQVKGAVKEAVGKVVGDAKLESEGKADKAEGKVQNAIGGRERRSPGRRQEIVESPGEAETVIRLSLREGDR